MVDNFHLLIIPEGLSPSPLKEEGRVKSKSGTKIHEEK
jgi:hypothetical protein